MRQSSASLEERVEELEIRVNVLESLLAERYPATPTPAPLAVEPSSKKKQQQIRPSEPLLPMPKHIYLKNPDEPKTAINNEFAVRIVDFDKINSYTSNPEGADVALYFMFVSGGRPDLTAVRRAIEKDNFPTRAMIFLCPGGKEPFIAPDDLLPGTKTFFFLLYDDWTMNKFEQPGSRRRTEQDEVLRNAIGYLTK